MQLGKFLDKRFILPQLAASTKEEVLAALLQPLVLHLGLDEEAVYTTLLEREDLGTTGIGEGIAIPHGRLRELDSIAIVVGRSSEGVDFNALDMNPCYIFFLVLTPEHMNGQYLRILAELSRSLKDETFKKAFLEASSPEVLWDLLVTI